MTEKDNLIDFVNALVNNHVDIKTEENKEKIRRVLLKEIDGKTDENLLQNMCDNLAYEMLTPDEKKSAGRELMKRFFKSASGGLERN